MNKEPEDPLSIQHGAVGEDKSLSSLKPSVQQYHLIDDFKEPLLTPQFSSSASGNYLAPNSGHLQEDCRQRHTQWLLIFTTVVITIAACQTQYSMECPSLAGLLIASLGLIWLQMQPDMQMRSTPLTKVEILMHCAAIVLCFISVFLVIYTEFMCRGGAGRSRPWARLSAYIAHGAAALASLWNVVDAAAIVQHFKSQDAAKVNDTDIEGCTANDTDGCTCNGSEAASESGDQEMTALVMLQ